VDSFGFDSRVYDKAGIYARIKLAGRPSVNAKISIVSIEKIDDLETIKKTVQVVGETCVKTRARTFSCGSGSAKETIGRNPVIFGARSSALDR
jgi:hypothetical protein